MIGDHLLIALLPYIILDKIKQPGIIILPDLVCRRYLVDHPDLLFREMSSLQISTQDMLCWHRQTLDRIRWLHVKRPQDRPLPDHIAQ